MLVHPVECYWYILVGYLDGMIDARSDQLWRPSLKHVSIY